MVPSRGNDVLSSSLIRGPCHSMGSLPCEPTEMGRGPDTQHSATLYGWNTFAFFTASAYWRAGEEYGVSCWRQGAVQGVLETSFGNALLVLWFTWLKKISEVRNTYLIWVFWKVNLRSLAESQDGRFPIIQSLLSFALLSFSFSVLSFLFSLFFFVFLSWSLSFLSSVYFPHLLFSLYRFLYSFSPLLSFHCFCLASIMDANHSGSHAVIQLLKLNSACP